MSNLTHQRIDREWTEFIWCPTCRHEQYAKVVFYTGDPFPTYVHECAQCRYVILESEWNPA